MLRREETDLPGPKKMTCISLKVLGVTFLIGGSSVCRKSYSDFFSFAEGAEHHLN